MTDPYRPPGSPVRDPQAAPQRSTPLAVLLGFLVDIGGTMVFSVVAMAAMHDLDLPHDKVNVHGGACALGHPLGASGARIMVTLLAALERYGKKRGIAALCIGGGEATAIAWERFG